MTEHHEHNVDLVIAGGGTAGISLALALKVKTSLNIAIVEANAFKDDSPHPGFDARSLALASHSCDVFKNIGVTDIEELGCGIHHIHVSDKGHLGQCRLHAKDYQLESLGTVVELHDLGKRLHQLLGQGDEEALTWYCPDSISEVRQQEKQVDVTLASGTKLTAKLLVVAEGGQSPTRKLVNIEDRQQPYSQVALIANVLTSGPHENWAFERFTQSGPLALLPLPENGQAENSHRCSLVWTIPPEQQTKMLEMPQAQFLSVLQNAFGYRLGRFTKVGERFCYPLTLIQASQHISHRALVMGNASQSLHPIAGQGLNIGIRDVETLMSLLMQAEESEQDIGEYALLNQYQIIRQQDQQKVVQMTDGLVRVFSNQYLPLVIGRNLGLSVMNLSAPLKASLAKQAMGHNAPLKGSDNAIL